MTKLRFQFLIGLLLVTVIVVFSSVFFRYTAQIAREMPKESVQMLQQAAAQAEHTHKGHGSSIVKKFIRFVQNIQKNNAEKFKKAPSVSTRVLPTFTPAKREPQEPALPPALQDPDQEKRVTDPLKKETL